MNLEELQKYYQEAKQNIDSAYENAEFNEKQYNEYLNNLNAEFSQYFDELRGNNQQNQKQANFMQYDEELSEIAQSEVLKNRFGAAILELGEGNFESIEQLIMDIADGTENEPEDVAEVLTGDALPDESFVLAMIEYFQLDDEMAEDLYMAAAEAYEEAGVSDDGSGEAQPEDEMENYNRHQNKNNQANFESPKVKELEQKLAEFQAQDELKSALNKRMKTGEQLVNNGDMPPAVYNLLFGNFDDANGQIAAFNQSANANNVSMEAELHGIDKTLDIFERMNLGASGMFQAIVSEQEAENEAQFEQDEDRKIENIARRNVEARKNR